MTYRARVEEFVRVVLARDDLEMAIRWALHTYAQQVLAAEGRGYLPEGELDDA